MDVLAACLPAILVLNRDRANRGPFPPGPPPAIGERCPRCHERRGAAHAHAHDGCLLCNPIPLWPMAARNLAAAYHPHRTEET